MGCRSCNSNSCRCSFSISPTRVVAASLNIQDTPSLDLTYEGGVLSGDVLISEDSGNIIEIRDDGLFAEGGGAGSITVSDTESVDLTLTGDDLSADVNISADGGNIIEIRADGLYATSAGGSGIIEVTTAELNTLVSGNDLEVGATYAITDHVQNRITAGTRVVVQAMSENQITSQCQVLTEYDDEYWRGVYDLATNKLVELSDNQGNTCRQFPDVTGSGPAYTPVDDFDWGNPYISNCFVENSSWLIDYGVVPSGEIGIDSVRLTQDSVLDMTGWLGGYIFNLVITGESGVDIAGSKAEFENASFTQSGFLFDRCTSAFNFYFLLNCEHSFISADEVGSELYMEGVTVSGYSGVYHGGTGEFIVHKAEIAGEAECRVISGTVLEIAEFIQSSMTACSGSGLSPQGGFYISGTNHGGILIYDSEISSSGRIDVNDANVPGTFTNPLTVFGTVVASNGAISINATTGEITIENCTVDSEGEINISNSEESILVNTCNVSSSGQIIITNIAGEFAIADVLRCDVSTNGVLNITESGDPISDVNVVQGTLNNGGFSLENVYILGAGTKTATANNSATAKDYFNDSII